MKKVAVLLAGSGYLDGSEIRESVLALLALDSLQVEYDIFSLNKDQYHVINHLTGQIEEGQVRNILEESARIARGDIFDIVDLDINDYGALIIPGGFGVAKNLCQFALEGIHAEVDPLILGVIQRFYENQKPIGAICISPALIALSLGNYHPHITLGSDSALALEIEKAGVSHQDCRTVDCVIDKANKIVTTPAYMDAGINLADAYLGISKLVTAVLKLSS